jgi:hypothetical protein
MGRISNCQTWFVVRDNVTDEYLIWLTRDGDPKEWSHSLDFYDHRDAGLFSSRELAVHMISRLEILFRDNGETEIDFEVVEIIQRSIFEIKDR